MQIYVPEGEFLRGSADNDSQAKGDEKPQRTIYLDAFWIDQTEVTNAMYALCVQAAACQPPSNKGSQTRTTYYGTAQYDNYPVIYVSWDAAQNYCAWAGRRLPTEAQWEKAARGTDGRLYPWGNSDPSPDLANFNRNAGDTSVIGSYSAGASPYGALDMSGNVMEWVADWYDSQYYAKSPPKNPQASSRAQHVLRGGSWFDIPSAMRIALRSSGSPGFSGYIGNVGFRCAQSP